MNTSSSEVARGIAGVSGSSAACRSASTLASVLPSTEPGAQLTFSARIASMHWPNVCARTATPPGT